MRSFEAAKKAAWEGEAAGALLLPEPSKPDDADAGEGNDAGAGKGTEESKGDEGVAKAQAEKKARLDASQARIRLNVGGQVFETTAEVLRREPESLLSALTYADPPVHADESGTFFFDRDWCVSDVVASSAVCARARTLDAHLSPRRAPPLQVALPPCASLPP